MSIYLLDTCALLWWMADSPELSLRARRIVGGQKNQIFVSVASLWEIAIKRRKGRLVGVDEYLGDYARFHHEWRFLTLPIEASDAVAAGDLALPHEDPFDRMLIVQSRRISAQLVTCDEDVRRFAPHCVW